jgi:hypothetical protein
MCIDEHEKIRGSLKVSIVPYQPASLQSIAFTGGKWEC